MERTLINKNNNSSNKVKETWEYNRSYSYGKETLGSKFSWPPRPYTCSFCKREFRSAQALGGHMNIHRRDRARLNQSIPWDINQYQHANFISPNPNFHPSSSTAAAFTNHHFPPAAYPSTIAYSLPSSTTPPSITACSSSTPPSTDENIRIKSFISSSSFSQLSSTKGQENAKNSATTALPMMEMSSEVGDGHQLEDFMNENYNHHQYCDSNNNMKIYGENVRLDLEIGLCCEDDLDLELRLGFSS
ncbi:hypothetical protein MKX03_024189 [Papaver bracteatum]|nr:hypothetical protein MKX03_024189 [Papaver bracteatum]